MHLSKLKEKYKKLVHNLDSVEKTIISLKGELKWNPSVSSALFREYDGAINTREILEEELYELDVLIKRKRLFDSKFKDCNNVIFLPCRNSINKEVKRAVN